jgi:hypothetical protein
MSTCRPHPGSHPVQNHWAAPTAEQLFGYATEQINLAASESWPGEWLRLAEHVPSVTGYVRRIEVGGRTLFAKYSYLGSSLVSVLRGRCGDWDQVRAAQQLYTGVPGSLLEREAAQLRLLQRLGRPRAHRAAALCRGVLFTEMASGAALAQLFCAEPRWAGELLGRTWAEVRELHRPDLAQRFAGSLAIEERSVTGTFARKFKGIRANVYFDQLAAEWHHHPGEYDELWETLRRVVIRLGRPRVTTPVTVPPVLVYGDLKPEHIVFEHHAIASTRPVFIDPGMSQARTTVDAAKLVRRTILLLIGLPPLSVQEIGDALVSFVEDQTRALPAAARREWLGELVLLWLMDTVNILTTYLSAPAGLPLPAHAEAALSQARTVGALLDKVSAKLTAGINPQSVWRLGLAAAVGHAQLAATA